MYCGSILGLVKGFQRLTTCMGIEYKGYLRKNYVAIGLTDSSMQFVHTIEWSLKAIFEPWMPGL
jgi:hypothetical protein